MWYMTTINAYDALDRVHVTATVRATAGSLGDPIAEVYSTATTVPGVGEDDPVAWLRDACIALLEVL